MVFYCKMCGGELELDREASIGCCQYCGSKQTIPKTDDKKILNLFNRANHYRIKNDFENAMSSYENILNEDADNAEAYWGLCLCRYGIEYVKDPVTEKMLPTCHRTQFDSILEDDDFLNACEKADSVARSSYEEEAKHIDKIQKKILELSSKEEDYDVFICYKEADEMGERTPDSVIGQEIYEELTQKNLRVFFARISLEDKVGTVFEPYIFAALQSAPIMITIGTKPEYMEAVWVKNEWSRFLQMMKKDSQKTLIPVYKSMNPYDMPEGFASIQAVNMEKIGAMQDLVHGVEKILGKNEREVVEKVVRVEENETSLQSYAPLLARAWIFLEDQKWDKADEYAERVLDLNPKCGEAYMIKMLAKMKIDNRTKLSAQENTFDTYDEYKKIIKFGNEELVKEVEGYNRKINERKEAEQKRIRQELEVEQERLRKKREEEIRKKKEEIRKKKQVIYSEYEEELQEKEKHIQELKDKRQEYFDKIALINKKKKPIEEERKKREAQYIEASREYNEKIAQFEKKHKKRVTRVGKVNEIVCYVIKGLCLVIGLGLTIYCDICLYDADLGGFYSFVGGIVGVFFIGLGFVVGNILYDKVYLEIFGIDTYEEFDSYRKKLKRSYPNLQIIEDSYEEICLERDELVDSIIELQEERRKCDEQLRTANRDLQSVRKEIKKRIDKIC